MVEVVVSDVLYCMLFEAEVFFGEKRTKRIVKRKLMIRNLKNNIRVEEAPPHPSTWASMAMRAAEFPQT